MCMNFQLNLLVFCFLSILFSAGTIIAEETAEQPSTSSTISSEMMERFERLEAETQRLRNEVARLNAEKNIQATSESPEVQSSASETEVLPVASPEKLPEQVSTPAAVSSQQEKMTREEVDAYIERHIQDDAWKVGKMKLTPYGIIWASLLTTDRKTAAADWIGRPLPGAENDRTVTSIQARTSRLGLKVAAPDLDFLGGMKSHGLVEVDFANACNAENKGTLQLREAYWVLENDCYKILFGQTKDIISPLYARFRDYNALYGNGNLGYRNPMLSFTRFYRLSENVKMDWATGLVQICGQDHTAYDQMGSYPSIQSRIGWTIARETCKYPVKFGIGAHIGEQRYSFPQESDRITSWSVNTDLELPFTDRFGFRAEFFHGQGLAGNVGGCFQSIDYNPVTQLGSRRSIHSTGGWFEFWWDWTEELHWVVGYSGDDPHNSDMEACNVRNSRILYANVMYDFSKFLTSGLQYTYHTVDYRPGVFSEDVAHANGIEWLWKLTF